ncbi:MAG: Flp/Fap pilin component [Actinomycetota bacterium]|nr:Flp/Fap pilin component [Actinomycetota bacterium]
MQDCTQESALNRRDTTDCTAVEISRIRSRVCSRGDDRGASAVEYALLIAGIAAVIIVAVTFVGKTVSGQFSKVGSSIASTN